MFSHFDPILFTFLQDLAAHNDKDWFNEHKQDYEAKVRTPALAFIEAMEPWVRMISPHYEAVAKKVGGSLMRVYRDVRFSKDKSPREGTSKPMVTQAFSQVANQDGLLQV